MMIVNFVFTLRYYVNMQTLNVIWIVSAVSVWVDIVHKYANYTHPCTFV